MRSIVSFLAAQVAALLMLSTADAAVCQKMQPPVGFKLSLDEAFSQFASINAVAAKGWKFTFEHGREADGGNRRNSGGHEIYVDPDFAGAGDRPLGLNPFAFGKDGVNITATRTPPQLRNQVWGAPYISGMLNSRVLFSQQYGYFEARMRLPAGAGAWPAFWLLPINHLWPPEIDVIESLGDPAIVVDTVHTNVGGVHAYSSQAVRILSDPAGFHRFGVLWTESELIWFVDGVEVYRKPTPSDAKLPMYILFNLAVGGQWPGEPSETFKALTLAIDYVRVWKLADSGMDKVAAGMQPDFFGSCSDVAKPVDYPPPAPGHTDQLAHRADTIGWRLDHAAKLGSLPIEEVRRRRKTLEAILQRRWEWIGQSPLTSVQRFELDAALAALEPGLPPL